MPQEAEKGLQQCLGGGDKGCGNTILGGQSGSKNFENLLCPLCPVLPKTGLVLFGPSVRDTSRFCFVKLYYISFS